MLTLNQIGLHGRQLAYAYGAWIEANYPMALLTDNAGSTTAPAYVIFPATAPASGLGTVLGQPNKCRGSSDIGGLAWMSLPSQWVADFSVSKALPVVIACDYSGTAGVFPADTRWGYASTHNDPATGQTKHFVSEIICFDPNNSNIDGAPGARRLTNPA